MAKKKIAILGGGMAGLSAAYQLTKTQALRDLHDVTVYQLGWRLGGKAASGRDKLNRNLEHGLHVWFGCYENTFQMLQELYAANPPGGKLPNWQAAVKPQAYTPPGRSPRRRNMDLLAADLAAERRNARRRHADADLGRYD